ncbi:hypothetical protein PAECIP112173_03568 [Paenibacillus sp. JJ-100]|uniref:RNA polymerase sigma factor n=1 Tax=Paenibacillus sp. JJ-100 TaxID=2974896 RepID=UPI0022FFA771|nr:RNA polymerase sigma factor [Paenibacillus sp. JJ-100]CAI6082452.1 hypothetical protein PAECIP112173_03568 [Paenibacillus sp. JJ-100]
MAFVKSVDCQIDRPQYGYNNTCSYYRTDEWVTFNRAGAQEHDGTIEVNKTTQGEGNDGKTDVVVDKLRNFTLHSVLPELMKPLYAYCFSLTKSVPETEDLVQETCLKALSSAAGKASERTREMNWEAYLIRIARNTWIDGIRKQEKLRSILDGLKPVVPAYVEEESFEELESAVQLLVNTLPSWQRAIYILREILGYKAAETAQMLGTTEGAVKTALNRARTALSKVRHALDNSEMDALLEKGTAPNGIDMDQEQLRDYLMAFRQGDTTRLIDLCLNQTDDPMAVAGTILQQTLPSPSLQPVMYGYATSGMNLMSYGSGYTVIMAA